MSKFTKLKQKIQEFKLNNYQKVSLTWGGLIFFGHLFTNYFYTNLYVLLGIWAIIISVALFVQVNLMWYEQKKGYATHVLWLLVAILGSVFTYLIFVGRIEYDIVMSAMWFFVCGIGMVITSYLQKNSSYIFLATFYVTTAIMFQILIGKEEVILAGIMFLFLCIIDALLEYSPLRNPVIEVEDDQGPMTFRELRKLEEKERRFSDETEIIE